MKAKGNDLKGTRVTASVEAQLDTIREILLQQDRGRIQELQEQVQAADSVISTRLEELVDQLVRQKAELSRLHVELDELRREATNQSDDLMPQLISQMSGIIGRSIQDSREDLAEALGPVMSDAIRVKIRDSRDEMVETLYPIILAAVQRAITEFAREFQRNVDARLKATFGPRGLLHSALARLRGVSPSEVAFRNAFPHGVQEIFLIQHESGLLLARSHSDELQKGDSDLVSGMLTAIRDFARDTLGDSDSDQGLDEIQYGDHRIIIQSGQHAYLAVVTTGVEPEWFRARLRRCVSELHIRHTPELRDYSGDAGSLPGELPTVLAGYAEDLSELPEAQRPVSSRGRRLALAGGALVSLLVIGLACFYLQFTVALLPVAFGQEKDIYPVTSAPAARAEQLASPTVKALPVEARPIATASPTETPAPRPTDYRPIADEASAVTISPVWIRNEPNLTYPVQVAIPEDTAVEVLAQRGEWIRVSWSTDRGDYVGWLPMKWVTLEQPIPPGLITPVPDATDETAVGAQ